MTSNPDPEYKIYKQEDNTPPSTNDLTYHDESNAQKSLGSCQADTSIPPPSSLYVSESSNMDYVSLPGVCKRTGSDETPISRLDSSPIRR